jgi:hypothetical protein
MIAVETPTHVQGMLLLLIVCAAFSCAVQLSISSELGLWTEAGGRGGRSVASLSSFAPPFRMQQHQQQRQQQQQQHAVAPHSLSGKKSSGGEEFSNAVHLVASLLFELDNTVGTNTTTTTTTTTITATPSAATISLPNDPREENEAVRAAAPHLSVRAGVVARKQRKQKMEAAEGEESSVWATLFSGLPDLWTSDDGAPY